MLSLVRRAPVLSLLLALTACGSLEKKAALINVGDSKAQVMDVMGAADDRQLQGLNEAWQYCQSGAGLGWHDYRVIWFYDGKVTGVNSYKTTTPGSSCTHGIKTVQWEDAPDTTLEVRHR